MKKLLVNLVLVTFCSVEAWTPPHRRSSALLQDVSSTSFHGQLPSFRCLSGWRREDRNRGHVVPRWVTHTLGHTHDLCCSCGDCWCFHWWAGVSGVLACKPTFTGWDRTWVFRGLCSQCLVSPVDGSRDPLRLPPQAGEAALSQGGKCSSVRVLKRIWLSYPSMSLLACSTFSGISPQ